MGRKNKRKKTNMRPSRTWRDYYLPKTSFSFTDHAGTDRGRRYPVRRGDVFFAELGYHNGTSVQSGCRPVLVISNDRGNYHSDTINVIPMTGCFKRPDLPCHMVLYPEQIKNRHRPFSLATVLTEQITTISKSALRGYVGRIEDQEILSAIERTLSLHLGLSDNDDHSTDEHNNNTEVNHVQES